MIYVDDYRGKLGRMVMSHLMSTESLAELHAFAAGLGLDRKWFQAGSAPHYDVCQSKRRLAIRHGAIPVSVRNYDEWRSVYRAAKALGEGNV